MLSTRIRDKSMKKTFFIAIATIVVIFGLSSCATTSKLDVSLNGTNLNEANFEYVRPIIATAKNTYIFGLGGGNAEQQAIDNLRRSANLKENQALTNYSVTTSKKMITPIVIIKTVTASADIVEFKK